MRKSFLVICFVVVNNEPLVTGLQLCLRTEYGTDLYMIYETFTWDKHHRTRRRGYCHFVKFREVVYEK